MSKTVKFKTSDIGEKRDLYHHRDKKSSITRIIGNNVSNRLNFGQSNIFSMHNLTN